MSLLQKQNSFERAKLLKKYCLVSGGVAAAVMLVFYLFHSNSLFFGDSTVLRMDLYHQYGPLYAELYDRIMHGKSLIYSWTSGLGNSFLGNLFNYCSSPFAFVILLLGHKNMPEAIAVMILLKAVVSAGTFTYYINKTTNTVHPASIGFGQLYAFCGYFVAYSWNIMWLDAMAVFPLVILGIEHIINRRKPALYIAALSYTMLTNYYMAYMVCIISVLYFLFYYFSNYPLNSRFEKKAVSAEPRNYGEGLVVTEERSSVQIPQADVSAAGDAVQAILPEPAEAENYTEKIEPPIQEETLPARKEKNRILSLRLISGGLLFAVSSVLCFFIAAFALIPVYFCLKSSSATGSSFPTTFTIYFKVFDFLANHLPSVEPTIRSSGEDVLPNVFSGVLSILLLPAFFISDKITSRKKITAVCILGVFYFSFSINYLNFIWHGFHFPNDLPYRFSFAYSFILLTLAYSALLHIADFSRKYYVVTGIATILFVIFVQKIGSKNVSDTTLLISVLFVLVYVILAGLITAPLFTKKSLQYLLIFAIIVELVCADTNNFVMSQSKTNYTADYDAYRQISELTEKDETELFYRTELAKLRARMDPSWYGYNGVSVFSSMAYEKTSSLMKSLGLFGNNINSYTYYPQTPVFNAFFSVKYVYDNADLMKEAYGYSLISSNEKFEGFRNDYYLPFMFSVNDDIRDWTTTSSDPFAVQNDLVRLSTGVDGVLDRVDATNVECSNFNYVSPETVNFGTSFAATKTNASDTGTITVSIDVAEDGRYYVYAGSTRVSGIKFISADDISYNYISSSIQPFILDMGERKAGDRIAVEYTMDSTNSSGTLTFCAAKLNKERFEKAYNTILSNGVIALGAFDETSFSGTIKVMNADSFIYTSIPYDKSWNIYVDGEKLAFDDARTDTDDKTAVIAVGGGLIGFPVTRGEHTVTFKYAPRGLYAGLFMSACGIFVCAVWILIYVFVFKKRRSKDLPVNYISVEPAGE